MVGLLRVTYVRRNVRTGVNAVGKEEESPVVAIIYKYKPRNANTFTCFLLRISLEISMTTSAMS